MADQQQKNQENPPQDNSQTDVQQNAGQSVDSQTPTDPSKEKTPDLPDFTGMDRDDAQSTIELLKDVDLNVKIELGRAEMTVDDILKLADGSVIELNKLAGDPVDVLINEQLVARGEVLVVNDNFCVRINEIVPGVTEKMMQN